MSETMVQQARRELEREMACNVPSVPPGAVTVRQTANGTRLAFQPLRLAGALWYFRSVAVVARQRGYSLFDRRVFPNAVRCFLRAVWRDLRGARGDA